MKQRHSFTSSIPFNHKHIFVKGETSVTNTTNNNIRREEQSVIISPPLESSIKLHQFISGNNNGTTIQSVFPSRLISVIIVEKETHFLSQRHICNIPHLFFNEMVNSNSLSFRDRSHIHSYSKALPLILLHLKRITKAQSKDH